MKRFRSAAGLVLALVLPTVGGFAREYFVYFGTYTGAKSKGIYVSRFDTVTGKLAAAVLAAETPSPSFLALHPNGRFLFAAGESSQVGAAKQGGVSAFATGLEGKLKLLNTQPSGGNGPFPAQSTSCSNSSMLTSIDSIRCAIGVIHLAQEWKAY